MREQVFLGQVHVVEQKWRDGQHTINVEARDMAGAEVNLAMYATPGFQIPTPGQTLVIERDGLDIFTRWNHVEYAGSKVADLSVRALDVQAFGGGPALGFGGNVNHSWECPDSLKDEAYKRAKQAGMAIEFDVNKLTVVTNRGTLHVTVDPPTQMAGFTADMCMLTWQMELRTLGLAA